MGDLISMTSTPAAPRFRPKLSGETAEILFFTGVRYYRMPDAVPAAPPEPSRGRRRSVPRVKKVPRLDCLA